MRILFVEDDKDTAAYIKRGLEREGHNVDHCADGQEGAVQALGEPYDLGDPRSHAARHRRAFDRTLHAQRTA